MIFSVALIVNYYWDHDSVYGKTIECGGMICEICEICEICQS